MKWLLMIVPSVITYYCFTFGLWTWRRGNRGGGTGVFFITALGLAMTVYALFIRTGF